MGQLSTEPFHDGLLSSENNGIREFEKKVRIAGTVSHAILFVSRARNGRKIELQVLGGMGKSSATFPM